MTRLIIIILLHLFTISLFAQDWEVPSDKKGKLSPFAFNDETRKAGERLYTINCMSCHGTPGKGNFITLVPPSGDPATEKIQHNTDGEIFYKVTSGRGPMPSFRNSLSANDIWKVVSFLRSFNTNYTQSVMPVIKSAAYPGSVIAISLILDKAKNNILMKVSATSEKSTVPVKDAGVKLYVKRTFGLLPVDEDKVTDTEGLASFAIPEGLPGDTAGNVYLTAGFIDEDLFGAVTTDTVLQAGIITVPESLVKNRAMWNTVRKAPVWIILTYGIGVIGVWGFIIFVLLMLRDIFIAGKHLNEHAGKAEANFNED
jgi:mono/diheme cytochrome c family protein